jgi:hypothetical protein
VALGDEARRWLKVSPNKLQHLIDTGMLPVTWVGRRRRFRVSDARDAPGRGSRASLARSGVRRRRPLGRTYLPPAPLGTVPLKAADDVLEDAHGWGSRRPVAKRVDSRYEPGKRSADWRKMKCDKRRLYHAPLRHER